MDKEIIISANINIKEKSTIIIKNRFDEIQFNKLNIEEIKALYKHEAKKLCDLLDKALPSVTVEYLFAELGKRLGHGE